MSWRLVCGSAVGTSHISTGTPCQDSCQARVARLDDRRSLLSLFVADGAGSALCGGEGATLAVEAAMAFIAQAVRSGEIMLDDALATGIVLAVRERIASAAGAAGLMPRDYACTFLGALSTDSGTLLLQIGDGGLVIDTGAGLTMPLIPMSGEYANMTWFVTDDEAVSLLQTWAGEQRALKVAAFSDGLQRLALNLADNTPHQPFFAPFFRVMGEVTPEQAAQLPPLLEQFLASEPVNARTDDDKTLALALWGPPA